MKLHQSAALCALVALLDAAGAVRLKLEGRRQQLPSRELVRRGNIFGSSSLNDSTDVQYNTNVTLNGQSFQALIDTGSSDLWVAGTVQNAQDTGKQSGVSYAVGQVTGPIKTAQLQFAGYTVDNQAYLEVPASSNNVGGSGLIGLGPASGSNILETINNASASPVLDRIFQQNKTTPNILTILLDRSDDADQPFPGDLTVGEILPGFEAINNQPKLTVSEVPNSQRSGQHWQTLLDKDGIIGPDGQFITVKSVVSTTTDSNRATVIFDSGFSLPQVPKSVSDAIYSGISGAKFENISGIGEIWTLPCDQEVNITFVFSGVKYPIHPLDTNMNGTDLGLSYTNGDPVCIGPFQPTSFDSSFGSGSSPTFDMILGMAFLRNTYLLINFGDFVEGTTNTADPYIQLLSTTNDTANAHQDFVKVRLDGKDTTTDRSGSTPVSSRVKKYAIIGGAIALGILAFVIGLCFCCFRKRGGRTATQGGVLGFGGQTYRPLNEPAPNAAVETHALPNLGYSQGNYPPYGPGGSQQQYQTAWDHRY